ncbi:MAG TPA: zf-HC2 domain-containing protein [Thermoleophilia bacterium]|nr:zf-HC2 domain-containing protein [Thermoleophilia bacterium]
MDCSYFCSRLNQFVDGELGYLEVAELQGHLSFCPDCAAELARISEVRAAMAAWGEAELAPPPGFAERVLARAALDPVPGSRRPFGRVVFDTLDQLDEALGRVPLPGGRTVPVKNVIGYGIAAAALAAELQRRRLRRLRELKSL